jgi:23S rRNA (cytidine1920-2'-O)/16S rRNA (cytidine1409-2'-O)-methyltransferase
VKRIRLDQLVLDQGLAETRSKARALILAGEILVAGQPACKAGQLIAPDDPVTLAHPGPRYVSRGGIKLAGALEDFAIDPAGWRCLDVGASTGGFTDCLLQRGAAHVFTIDVGTGQLDPKIRQDPRVTWRESLHARDLEPSLCGAVDLAVVDVSFISLRKVLPHVVPCIRNGGRLLALIKPQFEATARDVPKGVLRDEEKRRQVVDGIVRYAAEELRLTEVRTAECQLPGPKGNREVFLYCLVSGEVAENRRKPQP